MKGIIFTELVRFIAPVQSQEYADALTMAADSPSEGPGISVGSHMHTDVCSLYRDAHPPSIAAELTAEQTVIRDQSHRPMATIALGLVEGRTAHYGDVRMLDGRCKPNGKAATFTLAVHHG